MALLLLILVTPAVLALAIYHYAGYAPNGRYTRRHLDSLPAPDPSTRIPDHVVNPDFANPTDRIER